MKRISELSFPFIQEEFIGGILSPLRHVFARVQSLARCLPVFSAKRGVECHFSADMEGIPREKRLRLQKYSPPRRARRGGECALVTRAPAGNNGMPNVKIAI